jgi:N-acetylmuramoyl-L-alanine amidase
LAVNRTLRPGSQQLKGHKDVDHYMDGQTVKYTKGASTDYNEMLRLRKKLLDDFPQAFIIAFKDGQRMDITKAIQEFRLRGK